MNRWNCFGGNCCHEAAYRRFCCDPNYYDDSCNSGYGYGYGGRPRAGQNVYVSAVVASSDPSKPGPHKALYRGVLPSDPEANIALALVGCDTLPGATGAGMLRYKRVETVTVGGDTAEYEIYGVTASGTAAGFAFDLSAVGSPAQPFAPWAPGYYQVFHVGYEPEGTPLAWTAATAAAPTVRAVAPAWSWSTSYDIDFGNVIDCTPTDIDVPPATMHAAASCDGFDDTQSLSWTEGVNWGGFAIAGRYDFQSPPPEIQPSGDDLGEETGDCSYLLGSCAAGVAREARTYRRNVATASRAAVIRWNIGGGDGLLHWVGLVYTGPQKLGDGATSTTFDNPEFEEVWNEHSYCAFNRDQGYTQAFARGHHCSQSQTARGLAANIVTFDPDWAAANQGWVAGTLPTWGSWWASYAGGPSPTGTWNDWSVAWTASLP